MLSFQQKEKSSLTFLITIQTLRRKTLPLLNKDISFFYLIFVFYFIRQIFKEQPLQQMKYHTSWKHKLF